MTDLTIPVAAAADDSDGYFQDAAYPPHLAGTYIAENMVTVYAERTNSGPIFYTTIGLIRFDTSVIPDNATITSAKLRVYVEGRSIVDAPRNVTADWYDFGGVNTAVDFADTGVDAIDPVDISSLAIGLHDFTLKNPDTKISKSGYTGIRFHVDGGLPTGTNIIHFASFDHSSLPAPELVLTYVTTLYDPDKAIPSSFRALLDYVKSNIGTEVYDIIGSYPSAESMRQRLPLPKTVIHFEIDTIQPVVFGMGDNVVDAEYDDIVEFTVEEHEAQCYVFTIDVGIWASPESGGPTARLDARQDLNEILHGPASFEKCRALTDGIEILEFSGGRNLADSIGDQEVFRTVDLTLRYRVYARKVNAPVKYIDGFIQEPGIEIDGTVIIDV